MSGTDTRECHNDELKNKEYNSDQTDPSKPNHYSWTHFKTQILCVNVIGISMIHAGLTIAFTNLLNEHFDEQMVSTFASLSAISTPIGSCVVSFTVDKLGRKYNLLIIQGLCAGTWILASIIDGAVLLNLCAILAGFSRGALTASCPAYISEITHSQYRQLFLSLLSAFFTLGVCIICVLNLILTYKQSGIFLTACFLVLIIFTILLVPESPHWLAVIKMDLNTAKDNLLKLNPLQQVFDKEWSTIEEKIQKSTKILSTKEKLFLLRKSSVYKPTLALLGLIFFQQFCAIYPFTSYTLRTLSKLGNLGKQYESQIFLVSGILRFIIAVATSVILIKFNQKQLLLVSALGMMCSSAVIIFNREIIVNFIVDNQSSTDWINIISFTVYLITGFIGLLGIPWTIIFELLPTEIKGLLGPLLVGLGYATMSFTMKIFPFVYDAIGTTNVFVYVMIISAMALIYVHYVIIETKGKSLYEIENFYSKKQNEIKISEESDSA